MEKKDKKSGKRGRGLDTIGKRILVLTIAILMTFQFCTPTFYGISFADEEEYLETEQPVDEQAVKPAETPDEEVQAEDTSQGGAADPVLDEAVAEEPVDEVPAPLIPLKSRKNLQLLKRARLQSPQLKNRLQSQQKNLRQSPLRMSSPQTNSLQMHSLKTCSPQRSPRNLLKRNLRKFLSMTQPALMALQFT